MSFSVVSYQSASSSVVGFKISNEILHLIQTNEELELCISQKKNLVGHVGIGLKFSDEMYPRYTIDFGVKGRESKAAITASVPGHIGINKFDREIMEVQCQVETFELTSQFQKCQVMELFTKLLKIDMGDYNLISNNCRDFVVAACAITVMFKSRINAKEINWKEILDKKSWNHLLTNNNSKCFKFLRELKEEDEKKIKTAGDATTAVGGGVGGAAVLGAGGGLALTATVGGGIGATSLLVAAGVMTGGLVVLGVGLGVGISALVKLNRNRKFKKE